MTIPLPEAGDGTRRRRRAQRRRSGRRVAGRVLAVVALVAVLAGIAWVVVDLVGGDGDDDSGSVDDGGGRLSGPAPGLVMLTSDAGEVYGVTVFSARGGAIVHVPPGTLVEVPSLGLTTLQEAAAEGGPGLLQQSLENLLGLRFVDVAVLAPAEVAAMVAPVAPLVVEVGEPIEDRTDSGRVTVLFPAGPQELQPESVAPFLAAIGTGTSLERLVRHQAFWSALLDSGADAPVDAADALAGSDELQQRILPVVAISGVDGGDERYRIVVDDLAALTEWVFPDAPRAGEDRITVRVLNGAGVPGVAQQVQPLLVDAGGQLTLSGNADRFDYAVTQVVYYDDDRLDEAQAIRDALGVGEVVKSLTELDVVDVTVVVGADFLAAHPEG